MKAPGRTATVTILGTTQTLAWASSYYLPAMLAQSMARDLGISVQTVFAAFSVALVISALLGPWSGRCIDQWGGRPVLMATNLVFALGIATLGWAQNSTLFFAAWLIIGIGMGTGLYEAAFSTLVRLYGVESRNAITGVTLFAGFASTVGWPLSAWLEVHYGWRITCFVWAGLHLALGLPLNALVPRITGTQSFAIYKPAPEPAARHTAIDSADAGQSALKKRASLLMAGVFAIGWFTSTAMAAHLPELLQQGGLSLGAAVAMAALVGPAQVAGRVAEFTLLRRIHPLLSAKIATLAHPVGAAALLVAGGPAAMLFTVLHGAGNGILTIAKGTLPLILFGPAGYGARQGWLMVPARIAQALSPWLFGALMAAWGFQALWLTGLLGLAAFFALVALSTLHDKLANTPQNSLPTGTTPHG